MPSTTPQNGTPEDRQVWRDWAHRSGLLNQNGAFVPEIISERRRVFRRGISTRDTHLLREIEQGLINLFHFANSTTERWPRTIRVMLTKLGEADTEHHPFESWVGPQGLEKRKQATRVWTELVQFLVLEYHVNNMSWSADHSSVTIMDSSGYLTQMRLTLSNERADDIMDIVEAHINVAITGDLEYIRAPIHDFLLNIIMQEKPTPRNNPLLFWVALLLQTEEFGNQPRFEFGSMKDMLTMREKLEAIVHYARVLILDYAFKSWGTSRSNPVAQQWASAIEKALNPGNLGWLDTGAPRPADQEGDPSDFQDPHWVSFVAYFDGLCRKWLWKGSDSPVGVVLGLL
jgi:hypothetical protein